jgi:hypothetical protein
VLSDSRFGCVLCNLNCFHGACAGLRCGLRSFDRSITLNRTASAARSKEIAMTSSSKIASITKATNTVAANVEALAAAAVGLVDRQNQLDLDNVDLFAQTALFVREVLADIAKVKEFINLMKSLEIKMPPDLKQMAGMDLTDKEKSKLGQSNMLLPMMRTIFHDKGGKLRSYENYAYPMTQLLKDETLVTLDQLRDGIKNAVHETESGKKTKGIEALRALERASRDTKSRGGSQPVIKAIPLQASFMKGMIQLPKEVASAITFNEVGFGLVVVRKSVDGSADILFSAADAEGLTDIVFKGWQKVEKDVELDPRFKAVDLPAGIFAALRTAEAA